MSKLQACKVSMSPTARALTACRSLGYTAQVVEQNVRIPGGRQFKRDLFGCIDIVAITPSGILGIQVTSDTNHAGRREKILAEPRIAEWCEHGLFELWSFGKRGARGKRKVWDLRVQTYQQMQEGR